MSPTADQQRRIRRVGLIAASVVVLMVGMAYAAVPLYRAFCQLTGFGGTTQRAEKASATVLNQTVTVTFDTNVRGDLPWTFEPEQRSMEVKIGATGMAYFKVRNTSGRTITARATYNLVPHEAAYYFRKLQCFCFSDQTLKAGESAEFPMIFFVDPAMVKDDEAKNTRDITLSYSFFPTPDGDAPAAPTKTVAKGSALPLGGQARAGL